MSASTDRLKEIRERVDEAVPVAAERPFTAPVGTLWYAQDVPWLLAELERVTAERDAAKTAVTRAKTAVTRAKQREAATVQHHTEAVREAAYYQERAHHAEALLSSHQDALRQSRETFLMIQAEAYADCEPRRIARWCEDAYDALAAAAERADGEAT